MESCVILYWKVQHRPACGGHKAKKERYAMAKNQNNNVAPVTKKTTAEAKKDALATALAQIEKQFGKGAVMKLGDNASMQVDAISTGSLGLDLALGVGGVPRGRIIEVYGPESSGKTTLALHILAEAQKKGGEVAFIDVEHALDPTYAEALGVDINNLLVSQPDTGEQAMEICEALVRSGAIDAIVVDSVAAMVPRAEIEGEMGDSHVGLQARLMSQAMRKLTSVIGKTNTVCVFINQLREKVGIVYGNPEVTTGGRALKYYSSAREYEGKSLCYRPHRVLTFQPTHIPLPTNLFITSLPEYSLLFASRIC